MGSYFVTLFVIQPYYFTDAKVFSFLGIVFGEEKRDENGLATVTQQTSGRAGVSTHCSFYHVTVWVSLSRIYYIVWQNRGMNSLKRKVTFPKVVLLVNR
jgi:hypothetical protein